MAKNSNVVPMYETNIPNSPSHLSRESKRFWGEVLVAYELDEAALELLRLACEAMDRVREARKLIQKDGLMLKLRGGGQKAHPMLAIERDSRIAAVRILRELNLDFDPPADIRPPRSGGRRRL